MAFTRIAVLGAVAVTLATFTARWFWPTDLIANLRFQVLIAVTGISLLTLMTKQKSLIAISLTCLAIHGFAIVRAYQPIETANPDGDTWAMLTMNVLTSNSDTDSIANAILSADADLVALLEISEDQHDQVMPLLGERYPFTTFELQERGNFGIGLISRRPLEDAEVFQLNSNINSIQVRWNEMAIIATHPLPPMGARKFASRNEHLRLLAQRVAEHRQEKPDMPMIVMGDLNVTPWSPIFRDFQSTSGLHRAACGLGATPTWYARGRRFVYGLVLDHVLISDDLQVHDHRVGASMGSDHRGVAVKLQMAPRAK